MSEENKDLKKQKYVLREDYAAYQIKDFSDINSVNCQYLSQEDYLTYFNYLIEKSEEDFRCGRTMSFEELKERMNKKSEMFAKFLEEGKKKGIKYTKEEKEEELKRIKKEIDALYEN